MSVVWKDAPEKPRPKTQALEKIISWMDKHFKGDLRMAASLASEKAKFDGLVAGPLWDEIGTRALMDVYRKRLKETKRLVTRDKDETADEINGDTETEHTPTAAISHALWYHIDGRYYNLFDLAKPDVLKIAETYNKLARDNAEERDFLTKVAESLADGQQVKDVHTVDSLRELRKQV